MTTLASGHARLSILKETFSELLCSVIVNESQFVFGDKTGARDKL